MKLGGSAHLAALSLLLAVASCDATGLAVTDPAREDEEEVFCISSRAELSYIISPDAIPALTDPTFVAADHFDASYLEDDNRVIALVLDGEPLAFPIKVLQGHEIVNLNWGSTRLSISYCPLTGTGMVFDRSAIGEARDRPRMRRYRKILRNQHPTEYAVRAGNPQSQSCLQLRPARALGFVPWCVSLQSNLMVKSPEIFVWVTQSWLPNGLGSSRQMS